MADDKIKSGIAVVDQNTGISRGGYVGKQDNTATGAQGTGSMADIKVVVPPAEPGIGAAAKKATKPAKPAVTTPKGKIPASMQSAPVYHKGTMKVKKTGPAILKKGEMVVPAKKASAIRSQVQKVKKAKASMPMKKSMAPLAGDTDEDGM